MSINRLHCPPIRLSRFYNKNSKKFSDMSGKGTKNNSKTDRLAKGQGQSYAGAVQKAVTKPATQNPKRYLRSAGDQAAGMYREVKSMSNSGMTFGDYQNYSHATEGALIPGLVLAPNTMKYFFALHDPFDPTLVDVGYPGINGRSSFKRVVFSKGRMAVSSTGTAAILVHPAGVLTSNIAGIQATAVNTYVGANFPLPNAPGTASYLSNAPYSTLVYPRMLGRIVAMGLRVIYTGAILNRSGTAYAVLSPNGTDLGGVGAAQIDAQFYKTSTVTSVQSADGEHWISALWSPTSPAISAVETGFINNDARGNTSHAWNLFGSIASFPDSVLGILVNGASASGDQYRYEVVAHVEYISDAVEIQSLLTPSLNDPEGVALSDAAALGVAAQALPKTDQGALVSEASAALVENAAEGISTIRAQRAAASTSAMMPSQGLADTPYGRAAEKMAKKKGKPGFTEALDDLHDIARMTTAQPKVLNDKPIRKEEKSLFKVFADEAPKFLETAMKFAPVVAGLL